MGDKSKHPCHPEVKGKISHLLLEHNMDIRPRYLIFQHMHLLGPWKRALSNDSLIEISITHS